MLNSDATPDDSCASRAPTSANRRRDVCIGALAASLAILAAAMVSATIVRYASSDRVVVRDSTGRVRAALACSATSDEVPELLLFDATSKVRLKVSVDAVSIFDSEGHERTSLQVRQHSTGVFLQDERTTVRAAMTLGQMGEPGLALTDSVGRPVVSVRVSGNVTPVIEVSDGRDVSLKSVDIHRLPFDQLSRRLLAQ